jgi:hypothetical protein
VFPGRYELQLSFSSYLNNSQRLAIRRGVTSSSQTLLSWKRRPHFKHTKVLERTKIWPWVSTLPETKINCAGEGEQQIFALLSVAH